MADSFAKEFLGTLSPEEQKIWENNEFTISFRSLFKEETITYTARNFLSFLDKETNEWANLIEKIQKDYTNVALFTEVEKNLIPKKYEAQTKALEKIKQSFLKNKKYHPLQNEYIIKAKDFEEIYNIAKSVACSSDCTFDTISRDIIQPMFQFIDHQRYKLSPSSDVQGMIKMLIFNKILGNKHNSKIIQEHYEQVKKNLDDLLLDGRTKFVKQEQDLEQLHNDKQKAFKDTLEAKNTEFSTQIKAQKEKFDDYFDKHFDAETGKITLLEKAYKDKMTELENTYQEKLKLSKPAENWNDLYEKNKTKGYCALGGLSLVCLGSAICLVYLIFNLPTTLVEAFDGKHTALAIRYSILFFVLISLMAFFIRVITKFMFSSFHLANDAKEKSTLTAFYLSLLNHAGTDLDANTRQLIMQSLFGRVDTGLLKDSSPTLPLNMPMNVPMNLTQK